MNIKGQRGNRADNFSTWIFRHFRVHQHIWPTIGSSEKKAMISIAHAPRFLGEIFLENPNKYILKN